MKRYMPGMEHSELVMIGPSIGLRETRRLVGRTQLTGEDVLSGRRRADRDCQGGWKPEIHRSMTKMATYLAVKEGSWFDIPWEHYSQKHWKICTELEEWSGQMIPPLRQ